MLIDGLQVDLTKRKPIMLDDLESDTLNEILDLLKTKGLTIQQSHELLIEAANSVFNYSINQKFQ